MGAKKRVTLSLIWVTNAPFGLETDPTKNRLRPLEIQIMFPREMNIHYMFECPCSTKRQNSKVETLVVVLIQSSKQPKAAVMVTNYMGMLRENMIPASSLLCRKKCDVLMLACCMFITK
jgi:hypothetical protein